MPNWEYIVSFLNFYECKNIYFLFTLFIISLDLNAKIGSCLAYGTWDWDPKIGYLLMNFTA